MDSHEHAMQMVNKLAFENGRMRFLIGEAITSMSHAETLSPEGDQSIMIITLPSYAIGGQPFSVIVEKINHWHRIDYNGRQGTCIVMDNGAELNTDAMPYEVKKRIEDTQLMRCGTTVKP
jgi:hypothetical protein